MAYIKINYEMAKQRSGLTELCPFGALELDTGRPAIGAGCRMCRLCVKNGGGVFEFVEESANGTGDLEKWRGIAVTAEIIEDRIHPVTFELLGKARELAAKTGQKVLCLLIGGGVTELAGICLEYGADEVAVYDHAELRHFRIEPYVNAMEDFINHYRPSVILVGGTQTGRSLAPRAAARFRTGLTADCTFLDISAEGALDQIRPAYGGNIMAHINTPFHRPQFATVRYKIFSIPQKTEPRGAVNVRNLDADKLVSAVTIDKVAAKATESGIEEAEVLVAAGRGVKKPEDLAMLEKLAGLLGGKVACTRAMVENGWCDPRQQIGLSGRTVKPRLIITCGVSGAIQFAAGMNASELIVAINSDKDAQIFNTAHIAVIGDLYTIIPDLIKRIELGGNGKNAGSL